MKKAPEKFVLHVYSKPTDGSEPKLFDLVYDTRGERDAAWWHYTETNPGEPTWRTSTRRTA